MSVFFPFGIPLTSSYAETASYARLVREFEGTVQYAFVADSGPVGPAGPDAIPADCVNVFGSNYEDFPENPNTPQYIIDARQNYILCVGTTTTTSTTTTSTTTQPPTTTTTSTTTQPPTTTTTSTTTQPPITTTTSTTSQPPTTTTTSTTTSTTSTTTTSTTTSTTSTTTTSTTTQPPTTTTTSTTTQPPTTTTTSTTTQVPTANCYIVANNGESSVNISWVDSGGNVKNESLGAGDTLYICSRVEPLCDEGQGVLCQEVFITEPGAVCESDLECEPESTSTTTTSTTTQVPPESLCGDTEFDSDFEYCCEPIQGLVCLNEEICCIDEGVGISFCSSLPCPEPELDLPGGGI